MVVIAWLYQFDWVGTDGGATTKANHVTPTSDAMYMCIIYYEKEGVRANVVVW